MGLRVLLMAIKSEFKRPKNVTVKPFGEYVTGNGIKHNLELV